MNERIREHNYQIAQMKLESKALCARIEQKLANDGDVLKFGEIMDFVKENGLKRIWFERNMEVVHVYGGELFDYGGLQLTLTAEGSSDSDHLLQLLSEVGTQELVERIRDRGLDFECRLERIVAYTF